MGVLSGILRLLDSKAYHQLKMNVENGITMLIAIKEKITTSALRYLNSLPQKDPKRKDAVAKLKRLLNGSIKPGEVLPVAFKALQTLFMGMLEEQMAKLLPPIWDAVMNVVGLLGLPAASVGVDIGVGSGSVATEWISTGLTNIAQQVYSWIQTTGKTAFFEAGKSLMQAVLNAITGLLDGVYKHAVVPLNNAVKKAVITAKGVVKKKLSFLGKFVEKIKKLGKDIMKFIPPSLLKKAMAVMKKFADKLKRKFAPGYQAKLDEWKMLAKTLQ